MTKNSKLIFTVTRHFERKRPESKHKTKKKSLFLQYIPNALNAAYGPCQNGFVRIFPFIIKVFLILYRS